MGAFTAGVRMERCGMKFDLHELRPVTSGAELGTRLVRLGLIPERTFRVSIEATEDGPVSITASWWASDALIEALGGDPEESA